jgi:uncharacterized protein (TIGR03086 family)
MGEKAMFSQKLISIPTPIIKETGMSETIERWKLVTDGFTQRLDTVEEGQWDKATPCTEFTVRQLVEHVIDVQRMGPKLLGASGAIDTPLGSDLVSVWNAVRAAASAAYEAEGALQRVVDTPIGQMSAEQFIAGPAIGDALIHTWDLARAIGADDTLPETACRIQLEMIKAIPEEFLRQPGRFDAATEPPAGADAQTLLLCYAGRQP